MRKLTILLTVFIFYIHAAAATITVNWDGTGDYTTIQSAINAANNGDTIIVAPGTYYENINFYSKDITLTSKNPEDPNIVAGTVIDGSNSGSVVTFSGNETNNCELTGFTITNGYILGGGGGINGNKTLATITNCMIRNNYADYVGGGIYDCDGLINNCIISGNGSLGFSSAEGGGIGAGNGLLTNCIITDNHAGSGGGVYGYRGTIVNCIISENTAYHGGGLYYCLGSIKNSTIVNNTSDSKGAGFDYYYGAITNCIIWGNSGADAINESSMPTYSCIQDWIGGGIGNIIDVPLFVDEAGSDYHLQPGSHCIDAGTNSPPGGLPSEDLDGNPRSIDGDKDGEAIVDMGVYEAYLSNEPVIWLSEFNFDFVAEEGAPSPDSQSLTLRNSGMETLNWSIAEDCGWLTVTPDSGSSVGEPDEVTLSVDSTGLPRGRYDCELTVSDPSAVNNPQTILVTLELSGEMYVPADYPTIQAAIDVSVDGDTIIVAEGIYNENIIFNERDIKVTSIDPYDPNTVELTVINGSGLNSTVTFLGTESESCILTGFTITNGSAENGGGINGNGALAKITNCTIDGNNASSSGGGVFDFDGLVENCIVRNNTASYGGAFSGCGGVINNCNVTHNSVTENGGGLISCSASISNSEITFNTIDNTKARSCMRNCSGPITNCRIYGNDGNGMWDCNGPITNCVISQNKNIGLGKCKGAIEDCTISDNSYGGLYDCNGSITNCIITGNSGEYGGGLRDCDGAITNCTIAGNTGQYGGGLAYCSKSIKNCLISNNSAKAGGALYDCNGSIVNCEITGNNATGNVAALSRCDGDIINCTIAGNTSGNAFAAIYWCEGTISNCIIWGNTADADGNQLAFCSDPTYSCIQNWNSGGEGNIDDDPDFSSINDYHLSRGSLCIDAGDNTAVPEGILTDLDGNPRFFDDPNIFDIGNGTAPLVDIGTYEYDGSNRISVRPQAFEFFGFEGDSNPDNQLLYIRNTGKGVIDWAVIEDCNWLGAIPAHGSVFDETDAISLSVDISSLLPGIHTYELNISASGAINIAPIIKISLRINDHRYVPSEYSTIQSAIDNSINGDVIIVAPGTYYENIDFKSKDIVLTSTDSEDPNIVANTIINGGGYGHVVTFSGDETSLCEIKGFTITGGSATGPSPDNQGGGIFGNNTLAKICNCIISGNFAQWGGGGLHGFDGPISNCEISNNTVDVIGGGLNNCNGEIRSCTIKSNWAGENGGGIYSCGGLISDCVISSNSTDHEGGGLSSCDSPIMNCVITNNASKNHGGGIYSCDGLISNCTITNNTSRSGAGLYACDGSIQSCIIIGNFANWDGGALAFCDNVINSLIIGNRAGSGGGLYQCYGGLISNCTIVGNLANRGGGAYDCESLTNCIIWANDAWTDGEQLYDSVIPTYSCIQDWNGGGSGNMNLDPLFIELGWWDRNDTPDYPYDDFWVGGNYHIQESSPCIDAGTDAGVYSDLEGRIRPIDILGVNNNGTLPDFDMGAYEFTPNVAPVADAGEDMDVFTDSVCVATVTLDGSGSSDEDGDQLTYNWYIGEDLIASGVSPSVELGGGQHTITLIVNDGVEDSEPDEMIVIVACNSKPVADVGQDVMISANENCGAVVILDGSGSSDADADELSYYWYYEGELFAEGETAEATLGLGEHVFELIVNDGTEDSEPDEVVITVVDNTPPEFSVVMDPSELWPPDHQMIQVEPVFTLSDNCSDDITIELASITSNEGDQDDYLIDDGVYLRAERSGEGDGRVYILTYWALDQASNQSLARASVFVPHDQGQHYQGKPGDRNNDLFINYLDLAALSIQTEAGPLSGSDLLEALVLLAENWLE